MTLTPVAVLALSAQRHQLEGRPDERELARAWAQRLDRARSRGELVVLVQWEGAAGTPGETFSRGWTLYPDFRVEGGDLAVRAAPPDAFAGGELGALLHGRAVRELRLLALPGAPEREATAGGAAAAGFLVQTEDET